MRCRVMGAQGSGRREPVSAAAGTLSCTMPGLPPPLDPERLLTEDPFVRGLARQLLRDPDGAEELAQQTWVAALQARAPVGALRHWLAVLVRRLAGRAWRTERRHDARLRTVPPAPAVPSAADIAAREELRAAVVRAVLALDEPYRAVVL